MAIADLMNEIIMTSFILILLIYAEPLLIMYLLLSFLIIFTIYFFFIKVKSNHYGFLNQKSRGKLIKVINEMIGGIKEIRIMNRESYFINNYNDTVKTIVKSSTFAETINFSLKPLIETFIISAVVIILLVSFNKDASLDMIIPILALFAMASLKLLPSINIIINLFNKLIYNKHSLDPVVKDLKILQKISYLDYQKSSLHKKTIINNNIKMVNIGFIYDEKSNWSLKNINLDINRGQIIGIIGPSGSGKSTVVDIFMGLIKPISGDIIVDGVSIKQSMIGFQKNIGYVPQFIFISDNTISNNIALGERNIDLEKVKKACITAHIHEFIMSLPEQYDTIIGENGLLISGGQRQRIGLARALYSNPEILVLDEATSSLDNETENIVIDSIIKLRGDKSIIMIAHRLATLKYCDLIYVFEDGEIINKCKYEEISNNSDLVPSFS